MLGDRPAIFERHFHGKETAVHAVTPVIAFIVTAVVLGTAFPAHAQKTSGAGSSMPVVKSPKDSLVRMSDAQSADDSLIRLRDTNATKSALQSKIDSLNTIPAPAGGDTSHKPLSAFAAAFSSPSAEDTTYCFWRHPYWGIGAGWGLGSFPLFSEWQNGLPDSSVNLAGPGSKVPRFTVREQANSYNIFWPLFLSYTPFVNERHALSLESSFYFISKSYKVSLTAPSDSTNTSVEWSQSCAASFFTVGFDYRRSIPEEYFKVENVKRTTGNIGFSVVPLVHFTKRASFTSANIPDSTVAILNGNKDNRTFNGLGFSWKIGVSCLKKLSSKSGLEIGISYMGRYLGYFRNGATRMLWKDVNTANGKPNEKISLVSHTVELSFMLQNGKAAPANKK
jgi:hypothetical protein